MIRALVTLTFVIACYFIFYLFAMARTKEKRKMDTRVRALFDISADEDANKRANSDKKRKNPLRLEQIAEELYVAGVALRAEEFITIWILAGAVIPAIALFLRTPTTICIGLVIVGVVAPISWVTIKKNKSKVTYEDMTDYERRCNARDTHPDFVAYLKASEGLIVAQEDRLIKRIDLPSLRTAQA